MTKLPSVLRWMFPVSEMIRPMIMSPVSSWSSISPPASSTSGESSEESIVTKLPWIDPPALKCGSP